MERHFTYLIEVLRNLDPNIDLVAAEVEEAEALEDHFRAEGFFASRIPEEEGDLIAA